MYKEIFNEIKSIEDHIYFDGIFNLACVYFNIKNIARLENIKDFENMKVISVFKKLKIFHKVYNKYIYISKNEEIVMHIENIDGKFPNNKLLGNLLGFPDCCIEGFINNGGLDNKNTYSYLKRLKEKLKKTNISPLLNIFEEKLIYHAPCSFECMESIKIAEKTRTIYEYLSNKKVDFRDKTYIIFPDLSWIRKDDKNLICGNFINDKKSFENNKYIRLINAGYNIDIDDKYISFMRDGNEEKINNDYIKFNFAQ